MLPKTLHQLYYHLVPYLQNEDLAVYQIEAKPYSAFICIIYCFLIFSPNMHVLGLTWKFRRKKLTSLFTISSIYLRPLFEIRVTTSKVYIVREKAKCYLGTKTTVLRPLFVVKLFSANDLVRVDGVEKVSKGRDQLVIDVTGFEIHSEFCITLAFNYFC